MIKNLCRTCVKRGVCGVAPCADYKADNNQPHDELTRLKVDHARLTEAYMALRERYAEAFPGPIPRPSQRKPRAFIDVAFFPYPPEWDCLQEYISRGAAVVKAARRAADLLDRAGPMDALVILQAALEEHDR